MENVLILLIKVFSFIDVINFRGKCIVVYYIYTIDYAVDLCLEDYDIGRMCLWMIDCLFFPHTAAWIGCRPL